MRSTVGKNGDRWTLLLRLPGEETSIATGWNERGRAPLAVYRSAVERVAPGALDRIERAAAPCELKQGGSNHEVTGELLDALTEAYRAAAARSRPARYSSRRSCGKAGKSSSATASSTAAVPPIASCRPTNSASAPTRKTPNATSPNSII